MKISELQDARGKAFDALALIGGKKEFTAEDQKSYDTHKAEVIRLDGEITRAKELSELASKSATLVPGQPTVPATVENDPYVKDKSLIIGGFTKMMVQGGNTWGARQAATEAYGENHPVTKALNTSSGGAGGFFLPPDVYGEVIPLLRAKAVVRRAGPRFIPMPRGTMTINGQNSSATASYGPEGRAISKSQPGARSIVASYKKLTALVPISNDMLRYADPATDAFVRDDLVKVIALREDLAFLMSDGTQDSPRGFLSFANGHVAANGGTVGIWLNTAASTMAVNGADPANSTGGNFITSTANYTLATVAAELGGAINRMDTANVDEDKRVWFMHPRSYNYLYNVQNSLGLYAYREELDKGMLCGYPIFKTTQIRTDFWDASATNKDLSFVILVEMTEDMILDSMQLELAVFKEGSYVDETGATVSAMTSDQTVIRAIAEHDHQLRHQASCAVIQGVRWAPAIS